MNGSIVSCKLEVAGHECCDGDDVEQEDHCSEHGVESGEQCLEEDGDG